MQPSAQQLRWWDQRSLGDNYPRVADRTVQNVSDLRAKSSRPAVDGAEGEPTPEVFHGGVVQWCPSWEILDQL